MISSPSLFSFGVKMLTTMSFLTTKKLEQLLLILEHSILAFMRFLSRWTFTIDGQLTPYQEKLVCSYPFIDFHYLTVIYLKSINHFISNLINNFLYHLHPRTSFVEWKFLFCSNITIISNEGNGRNCRSWKKSPLDQRIRPHLQRRASFEPVHGTNYARSANMSCWFCWAAFGDGHVSKSI